jgi:hypothetical protein
MVNKKSKLKLAAGIIFFNDCSSLDRCLKSIENGVDAIFAVDGRFPNFPANSDLSTDGSRELVRSYSKSVLIDLPGLEVDKRTKYLEHCSLYSIDVLLIIDSDEYVLNPENWNKFHNNLKSLILGRDMDKYNVYAINLQTLGKSKEFLAYSRVRHKPDEMEYYGNRHYYFRNKNPLKLIVPHQADHSGNLIEGIDLGHNHELRSDSHQTSRFAYQM